MNQKTKNIGNMLNKNATFTRAGKKVDNLTFVEELQSYVGYINGTPFVWSKDGRCNKKYKSKNDLVQESNLYINLRNWNGRITVTKYNTKEEALKNTGRGYIKTINVSLDDII